MNCPDCNKQLLGFCPDLWCTECKARWDASSKILKLVPLVTYLERLKKILKEDVENEKKSLGDN